MMVSDCEVQGKLVEHIWRVSEEGPAPTPAQFGRMARKELEKGSWVLAIVLADDRPDLGADARRFAALFVRQFPLYSSIRDAYEAS